MVKKTANPKWKKNIRHTTPSAIQKIEFVIRLNVKSSIHSPFAIRNDCNVKKRLFLIERFSVRREKKITKCLISKQQ